MAAVTSKFYYVCVIQYYSDQWGTQETYDGKFTRDKDNCLSIRV